MKPPLKLYIIRVRNSLVCKIGVSRNPEHRCAALQTGFPYDLILDRTFDIPTATEEHYIHFKLRHTHIRGEWFRISTDDAIPIIREVLDYAWAWRSQKRDRLPQKSHENATAGT